MKNSELFTSFANAKAKSKTFDEKTLTITNAELQSFGPNLPTLLSPNKGDSFTLSVNGKQKVVKRTYAELFSDGTIKIAGELWENTHPFKKGANLPQHAVMQNCKWENQSFVTSNAPFNGVHVKNTTITGCTVRGTFS